MKGTTGIMIGMLIGKVGVTVALQILTVAESEVPSPAEVTGIATSFALGQSLTIQMIMRVAAGVVVLIVKIPHTIGSGGVPQVRVATLTFLNGLA